MSNPLPAGTIPKLRRAGTKSAPVGNFYIMLGGEKVKLGTADFFTARENARLAVEEGKRDFTPDRNPVPQLNAVPTSAGSAAGTAPPAADDWTRDLADAAGRVHPPGPDAGPAPAGTPEPAKRAALHPDAIFPPGLPPVKEGGDENAKDGETKKEGEEWTSIPPEMLDGILEQIADTFVQLQLDGQAWLLEKMIFKGTRDSGIVMPEVRQVPKKFWVNWLRKSFPTDVPLPEWLVAIVACAALSVPVQLANSTPRKKPDISPAS